MKRFTQTQSPRVEYPRLFGNVRNLILQIPFQRGFNHPFNVRSWNPCQKGSSLCCEAYIKAFRLIDLGRETQSCSWMVVTFNTLDPFCSVRFYGVYTQVQTFLGFIWFLSFIWLYTWIFATLLDTQRTSTFLLAWTIGTVGRDSPPDRYPHKSGWSKIIHENKQGRTCWEGILCYYNESSPCLLGFHVGRIYPPHPGTQSPLKILCQFLGDRGSQNNKPLFATGWHPGARGDRSNRGILFGCLSRLFRSPWATGHPETTKPKLRTQGSLLASEMRRVFVGVKIAKT